MMKPVNEDWSGRRDHVLVCGLHGVGLRIVEQLVASGVLAIVVDDRPDPRLVRVVAGWQVPHLVGDARVADTLHMAGLAGAAAVICVESDDLQTLETALLVRELRPDVPVVAQMRNPAVGRALAEAGARVIDVASIAAPSVIEACLSTDTHVLELAGEEFCVTRLPVDRTGRLRDLLGDLAPLAVVRSGPHPQQVEMCPGRDLEVSAGDVVTLFATPGELRAHGVPVRSLDEAAAAAREPVVGARYPRPRPEVDDTARTVVRHIVGAVLRATDRRLRLALTLLALLFVTSICVLLLGYQEPDGTRMTFLDAVYFTVETIATVGYGDYSFRQQSSGMQSFAIGLMIMGSVLTTLCFVFLTNFLISRRLEESLGQGRITGLVDHVVVIGAGTIGTRVSSGLLSARSPVVVIDPNEANPFLPRLRASGVPIVAADATLPDTLKSANLATARAVAVMTNDDLTNLEVGLAVRDQLGERRNEVPVVLRLLDRDLARNVRRSFGFRHVRSTDELAAPWFVGAALGLDVRGTFYAAGLPLLLASLSVSPGSALDAVVLGDLDAKTRVVAIERAGQLHHPPRRATRLHAGDTAFVVGPYEELMQLLRMAAVSSVQR